MKKILLFGLIAVLSLSVLAGCAKEPAQTPGNTPAETPNESEKIVIGVSPDPHAKIVELIKDDLAAEGIELEIVEFTDYVTPNLALAEGDLDANFFQHLPYLEDFKTQNNLDLVSLGNVHIEPMALYGNSFKSLEEIPAGAEIAIPNDTSNGGRALLLLEANGLIKLSDDAGLSATEKDIVENPKNIKFTALEAATLPRVYQEVDGAVINTNFALQADLNPLVDGIVMEGKDSPYANLVAVRAGEETEAKFVKLLEALQSDEVRNYINETYNGSVVPAF